MIHGGTTPGPSPVGPIAQTQRLRAVALVVTMALGACANQKPTQSGFLADYAALRPLQGRPGTLVARGDADLTRYTEFFVDPIVLRMPLPEQDATSVNDLAALLRDKIREELGKERHEAPTAGPQALRIRVAITHVTRAKPVLNMALTLVGPPMFNGGLSLEAEVTDGKTGARLAALSWADEGRFNPVGYYTEYGHPKALTQTFAQALARFVAAPAT